VFLPPHCAHEPVALRAFSLIEMWLDPGAFPQLSPSNVSNRSLQVDLVEMKPMRSSPWFSAGQSMVRIAGMVLVLASSTVQSDATTYLFEVSCSEGSWVAQWDATDPNDLDHEAFRIATGMKYPFCHIANYDYSRDGGLPREPFSRDGIGVIGRFPWFNSVLCGPLRC
jgi:hypothetical protein